MGKSHDAPGVKHKLEVDVVQCWFEGQVRFCSKSMLNVRYLGGRSNFRKLQQTVPPVEFFDKVVFVIVLHMGNALFQDATLTTGKRRSCCVDDGTGTGVRRLPQYETRVQHQTLDP